MLLGMAARTDFTYKVSWFVDCTVEDCWKSTEISHVLHWDFYPVVSLIYFLRLIGIRRQQFFCFLRDHHQFPRYIITSSSTKISKQRAQSFTIDQVANDWRSSRRQISALHNLEMLLFLNLRMTLPFWTNFLPARWCEIQQ